MVGAGTSFPEDLRWRCVEDLVLATAVLEQAKIIHGDLSPNNIVIDLDAPPNEPALYLIDFDAFVAPAAGADQAIDLADGGTYGTEGYCPPDLGSRAGAGDGSVAPYSDRYGRDILMLELLFMDSVLSPDDCASSWNRDRLERQYAAWRASCDPARRQTLAHLEPPAGLFATGTAAPGIDAACGRSGAGVAGEPRDLYRCAASAFPTGNARHSLGLGTCPTADQSPAGTWKGSQAKPPSGACTVSAAQSMVGECTGCNAHPPADAKTGAPAKRITGLPCCSWYASLCLPGWYRLLYA